MKIMYMGTPAFAATVLEEMAKGFGSDLYLPILGFISFH